MRVRERLISATAHLVQRHGVAGTGIAEILEVSGVTRRSIYLNFPGGKAELVSVATRSAGQAMGATLREYLTEPDPVAAFTQMWSAVLVDSDFEGGCPILAAACSRDEAPDAAAASAEVFGDWARLIEDRLVRDGADHAVAQSLSVTIVAALEGAVVLSRVKRTTVPLEQACRHMEELISLHCRSR